MQISNKNKNMVAFEFIIEVAEQAMDAWRATSGCRVCGPDSGDGEGSNGSGEGEKKGSVVQVYTGIAGKLIALFEAAIHAYPDETGAGLNAGSLAGKSPRSSTSFTYTNG